MGTTVLMKCDLNKSLKDKQSDGGEGMTSKGVGKGIETKNRAV